MQALLDLAFRARELGDGAAAEGASIVYQLFPEMTLLRGLVTELAVYRLFTFIGRSLRRIDVSAKSQLVKKINTLGRLGGVDT